MHPTERQHACAAIANAGGPLQSRDREEAVTDDVETALNAAVAQVTAYFNPARQEAKPTADSRQLIADS